ncbi:MAG: helix-turn-helix domain-containing protein [Oscillospiraceae bacterium]|nr:helix-turn-helix domain-containing protein [Oscillospiraceae bacterium]
MNNDFPRVLTLLRKERNISQKQAAEDLGVAQALLSHYEKGKRECGLEFLIKAANYYKVSTDYLLGRSPVSNGAVISKDDIEGSDSADKARNLNADELSAAFAKKLVTNSLDVIYSLLAKSKNAQLADRIYDIFAYSVYKAFRIMYKANPSNDRNIFKIPEEKADRLIVAGEAIASANAAAAASKSPEKAPAISRASLEGEFGKSASVLLNTVMQCENQLDKL